MAAPIHPEKPKEHLMFHSATILYPTGPEKYLYRDKDHREECIRRLQAQQPTLRIFASDTIRCPQGIDLIIP